MIPPPFPGLEHLLMTLLKSIQISTTQKRILPASFLPLEEKRNMLLLDQSQLVISPNVLCMQRRVVRMPKALKQTWRPFQLMFLAIIHSALSGVGEDLQSDLKSIFHDYGSIAEKLIKMGSTQNNESFNNSVATKNPKSNFYSGSESTSFRVAAAVSQTNISLQTLPKVYENLLLSPGKNTSSFVSKTSRKREYQKSVKSSIKFKRRRRELKSAGNKHGYFRNQCRLQCLCISQHIFDILQLATLEVKEGPTYEPAIDLSTSVGVDQLQEIPGTSSEIVQLACICGDNTFNRYVLLICELSASATAVTGLHVVGGELFCKKERVQTVPIETCLDDFKEWLQGFTRPVLVCHNGKVSNRMQVYLSY